MGNVGSKLNGQSKRDDGMIFRSCKASQSPAYPIRDAILAVNHVSCPSLSSSGPRQWGESALKTSRLPGALSLLAKSWLYPPSAWRLTCLGLQQPPPIPVEHRCLKATPHKVHVQELAEPTPLYLKQASTPRTPMIRLVDGAGTRTPYLPARTSRPGSHTCSHIPPPRPGATCFRAP